MAVSALTATCDMTEPAWAGGHLALLPRCGTSLSCLGAGDTHRAPFDEIGKGNWAREWSGWRCGP
jgi:hypothetical protein